MCSCFNLTPAPYEKAQASICDMHTAGSKLIHALYEKAQAPE